MKTGSRGGRAWIHHQEGVEPGFLVKDGCVEGWLFLGLREFVNEQSTENKECFVVAHLFGDQENTRLYLFILTVRTGCGVYFSGWGVGKCDTEIERRMQGGQNVRDDIHLVDPFHLGKVKTGKMRLRRRRCVTRRSRSPSVLHFCSARCR